MSKLCENLHEDVQDFMPLTFVVDVANPSSQSDYDKFISYFNVVEKNKKNYEIAEGPEE